MPKRNPVQTRRKNPHLPDIYVNNRPMREIVYEAWAAVNTANTSPTVFQRGGEVVEVVHDDHGHPTIVTLSRSAWQLRLDQIADFVYGGGRRTTGSARPPRDVVAAMLSSPDKPLPRLQGIREAPMFAPTGELLVQPGYDADTGLYFALPEALQGLEIPENPNAADQRAAMSILREELLGDFHFDGDPSVAHALAALLLPFVRLLCDGPTPLFLLESPRPRTGKTLLAQVVAIPALGRVLDAYCLGNSEDEVRRVLIATLAQGRSAILLDNLVVRTIGSPSLASAVTASTFGDRIVGTSRSVAFPVSWTWLLTANNPTLSEEIAGRTLSIRLVPTEEHPEERRDFRHANLKRWALANRPSLIRAALTIIQAWIAAGRQSGTRSLGGFESFAEVMGGILEAAGVPGFLQDRARVRAAVEEDPIPWLRICEVWWEQFAASAVTASDVFNAARTADLFGNIPAKSQAGTLIGFGKALVKKRDTTWGWYRVADAGFDAHAKVKRYRLERLRAEPVKLGQAAGVAGVAGNAGNPETGPN